MAEPRDLPLFAWRDTHRRRHTARRRRIARALILATGIVALCTTIVLPPTPRLVWNASPSAPIGLYHVIPPARLEAGDMAITWPPAQARSLAARRRYLPANVPLVKRVAAGPGARICAAGETVFIDDRPAARRLRADRAGRPLPWWQGCRTLASGEYFLLVSGAPGSFDGRYFGPTRRGDIVGKAQLLWAR